jgi:aminomethyltransferase
MADAQQSSLHSRHVEAGAKFADFAGWLMPLEYAGVVSEHLAVREAVGVFDVSHLGTLDVRGPQEDLNTVFSNDLRRIADGQAQYTLCFNEQGGVVDDLIVYQFTDDHFLLIPNAANCAEVGRRVAAAGMQVDDITVQTAIIAIQGPASDDLVARLGIGDLDYMSFGSAEVSGTQVTVCRTGYTGERGVELLVPAEVAGLVWEEVIGMGAVPCGLGARDTLRTEMGYPLHGHELSPDVPARWCSVGWAVVVDKPEFVGQQAYRDSEPGRKIVGLRLTDRGVLRAQMQVESDGRLVGETTSGTFSPSLRTGIALARVGTDIAVGEAVDVVVRAEVVKPPFVPSHVRG